MVDADLERFATAITALAGAFRVEVSEPLIEGFWLGLQDLEWEKFRTAVNRCIANAQHFPRPVEIRAAAGGQTAEMRSLLAWEAVRGAIRQHGAYRTVYFSDPAATAAVRSLGGWVGLCGRTTDELDKFVGREWRAAYEEFSAAGITQDMARPLDGIWSSHSQVDADSVRPRLVSIGVEPTRPLGAAPQGTLAGAAADYMRDLVRRAG